MQKDKRQFERFDLPLIVKFRTAYGDTQFSLGLTKNMSFDGLSIESRDFKFIRNEDLEMELKLPQSGSIINLLGNVIWRIGAGKISRAGISLKSMSENTKKHFLDQISEYGSIPVKSAPRTKETARKMKKSSRAKKTLEQPVKKVKPSSEPVRMGFTKEYIKGDSKCKVTFRLPGEATAGSGNVTLVGDFNQWNTSNLPLTRLNSGDFLITLDLETDKEYRFRYLIDGHRWENDWRADMYLPNSFGSDDSVVIV